MRARDRIGNWELGLLVVFLPAIYAGKLFGTRPDAMAIAWVGQAQRLLIAWGYRIDRHRVPAQGVMSVENCAGFAAETWCGALGFATLTQTYIATLPFPASPRLCGTQSYYSPPGRNPRNRLALLTTVTDDIAIAAPAIIGLSSTPNSG